MSTDAIRIPSLRMQDVDGSPDVQGVERIYLTNGYLSSLGNGAVLLSLSGSGGSSTVTIRDIDGTPSIANLSTLYVTNGFLSDLGGGNALLSMSGSAGAPTTAEYLVGALDGTLSAERLVTNTATVTWDLTVAGQAKANAASGQVLIDEEVISGTGTSSITLNEGGSNISSTYRHLRLLWYARSTTTAAKNLRIRFNGDTGANYYAQGNQGFDTTNLVTEENGQTSGDVGTYTASDGLANATGSGVVDIPYYGQTTFFKVAECVGGRTDSTTTSVVNQFHNVWASTAAITSVTLFASSGNFADGCRFSLYGVF